MYIIHLSIYCILKCTHKYILFIMIIYIYKVHVIYIYYIYYNI